MMTLEPQIRGYIYMGQDSVIGRQHDSMIYLVFSA